MNEKEKLILIKALNKALATVQKCIEKEFLARRGFTSFPYVKIVSRRDLLRYLGEV